MMIPSTHFVQLMTLGVVCILRTHGKTMEVSWTPGGVKPYRNHSNPVKAQLGDQLVLLCGDSVSNLFIQTDHIQYETCNASAGSGKFKYNGYCLPGDTLILTLTENSQSLMNTVNFQNNSVYFLSSYSNGSLKDVDEKSVNSGGQCKEGLKMIVVIGDVPLSDYSPRYRVPATDGGHINIIWTYIIGPVAFVLLLVIIILIIVTTVFIKGRRAKKARLIFADLGNYNNDDCFDTKEKADCSASDPDIKQMSKQELENQFGLNYGNNIDLQTFGPQHENTGHHGNEQGHNALAKRMKHTEVGKSPSLDKLSNEDQLVSIPARTAKQQAKSGKAKPSPESSQ